jgi:hypothetical protein
MGPHIDRMYKQVEDWLEDYEALHRIFQANIVNRFGLNVDYVTEPV